MRLTCSSWGTSCMYHYESYYSRADQTVGCNSVIGGVGVVHVQPQTGTQVAEGAGPTPTSYEADRERGIHHTHVASATRAGHEFQCDCISGGFHAIPSRWRCRSQCDHVQPAARAWGGGCVATHASQRNSLSSAGEAVNGDKGGSDWLSLSSGAGEPHFPLGPRHEPISRAPPSRVEGISNTEHRLCFVSLRHLATSLAAIGAAGAEGMGTWREPIAEATGARAGAPCWRRMKRTPRGGRHGGRLTASTASPGFHAWSHGYLAAACDEATKTGRRRLHQSPPPQHRLVRRHGRRRKASTGRAVRLVRRVSRALIPGIDLHRAAPGRIDGGPTSQRVLLRLRVCLCALPCRQGGPPIWDGSQSSPPHSCPGHGSGVSSHLSHALLGSLVARSCVMAGARLHFLSSPLNRTVPDAGS